MGTAGRIGVEDHMQIKISSKSGVTVAIMSGELRDDDQTELTSALSDAVGRDGSRIVFDLSGLTYINSGGLGLLVQLTAKANSQGGRVVVAAPSPFVADVLETTRLDRFFDVAADTDDAAARLAAQSTPASPI